MKNIITSEDLPVYASNKTDEEILLIKKELEALVPAKLKTSEIQTLDGFKNGKSFLGMAREQNKSDYTIRRHLLSGIAKIQNENNALPEDYSNLVNSIKEKYKIKKNKNEILNIFIKNTIDFNYLKGDFFERIALLSQNLGISETEIVNIVLKHPKFMHHKAGSINNKIETFAKTLKISKQQAITIIKQQPQLLEYKQETIKQNITSLAEILNNSYDIAIKLAIKDPIILSSNPETIKKNIKETSKVLNINQTDFIKASIKQPTLFSQTPRLIKKNVENSSKVLNISETDFINIAIKQPAFFYIKPETIEQNIQNNIKFLNVSKEVFIKSALPIPTILLLKPERIKNNVTALSELLNITKSDFIAKALKRAILFTTTCTTMKKRVDIVDFHKKIINQPFKLYLPSKSEKALYTSILLHLIKQNIEKDYQVNKKNCLELLNRMPDKILEFKVPKHHLLEDFQNFVSDFFEKNSIKNYYKFTIL